MLKLFYYTSWNLEIWILEAGILSLEAKFRDLDLRSRDPKLRSPGPKLRSRDSKRGFLLRTACHTAVRATGSKWSGQEVGVVAWAQMHGYMCGSDSRCGQ